MVECAFGKLCRKWHVFDRTLEQLPETVELITKTACILHNGISDLEGIDTVYSTPENAEEGLSKMRKENDFEHNFVVGCGKEVRKEIKKYVMKNPI